ncbi:endoglucanase IV precursor [Bimuria novae-zelandiae CBS 107.79]|uniref:Endoglucanase IV n=1 Tax=Bimuria novae-zelandiae CBS 107.79 TaxID=1447943 RepID=A0A6A5VIP3_9PLEO|nr:endoglucanase IV precursor [Bimuria novae-zelandiae CBS 107.79]
MRSTVFLAALPALVSAHGHVEQVKADGVLYQGWNAALQYQNPVPKTVGWKADNLDNGFVSPDAFSTAAIICHKQGTSNGASVNIKAGSTATLYWNTWPESHKGPVIDYIASCNGNCDTVSPASLQWIKLAQTGYISGSTWATDNLIAANNSWPVTIPSNLAPGNYVVRHEIIALHSSQSINGAQAYPQCINFAVTGSGKGKISGGVPATSFYKASEVDPGILFNLYAPFTSYTIPGPPLGKVAKREHAREFK